MGVEPTIWVKLSMTEGNIREKGVSIQITSKILCHTKMRFYEMKIGKADKTCIQVKSILRLCTFCDW